jgi:hypothetical protein
MSAETRQRQAGLQSQQPRQGHRGMLTTQAMVATRQRPTCCCRLSNCCCCTAGEPLGVLDTRTGRTLVRLVGLPGLYKQRNTCQDTLGLLNI